MIALRAIFFEQVTTVNDVFDIKKRMLANGAENAVMSGSGSAVFGIFKDFEATAKCSEKLKISIPLQFTVRLFLKVLLQKLINRGIVYEY